MQARRYNIRYAYVAHRVERRYRKPQVAGSSPAVGSQSFNNERYFSKFGRPNNWVITSLLSVSSSRFIPTLFV